MIKLGEYVIECNSLKMVPDSGCRHMVVNALVCYWIKDQKEKYSKIIFSTVKNNKIVLDKDSIDSIECNGSK